jgi:hypothetical protein
MKKIWPTIVLICSLLVFTYQHSLAVDDTPESSDQDPTAEAEMEAELDSDTPEFSNPAQAAHAGNLAEAFSSAPNKATASAVEDVENTEKNLDKANTDLDKANADLDKANADLKAAQEAEISGEIAIAIVAVDAAKTLLGGATTEQAYAATELTNAENALDKAVGELAGVSLEAISGLRESKMGWGQIAHELGVHPRAIGLGHTKKKGKNFEYGVVSEPAEAIADGVPALENEIAEATKRDIQHGWNNKGHGMTTSVSSGLGLSETDLGVGSKGSKASQGNSGSKSSKSSSAGSSKSSSKSSSASSSTGNSKSDRGSAGGPSNDKGNSGNSSSGASKSDKSNNGNKGGNSGNSGNNGKSK